VLTRSTFLEDWPVNLSCRESGTAVAKKQAAFDKQWKSNQSGVQS